MWIGGQNVGVLAAVFYPQLVLTTVNSNSLLSPHRFAVAANEAFRKNRTLKLNSSVVSVVPGGSQILKSILHDNKKYVYTDVAID